MPSDPSTSFSASYDSTTRITSAVIFVVLLGILALTQSVVLGCLFALLLVGAYAWSPRGYSIAQRSVIVKRLIGETSASRSTASARSESLLRMIFATASETFGNSGLFGYYGQFSTSKLSSSTWCDQPEQFSGGHHLLQDGGLQPRRYGRLPGGHTGGRPGPGHRSGRSPAGFEAIEWRREVDRRIGWRSHCNRGARDSGLRHVVLTRTAKLHLDRGIIDDPRQVLSGHPASQRRGYRAHPVNRRRRGRGLAPYRAYQRVRQCALPLRVVSRGQRQDGSPLPRRQHAPRPAAAKGRRRRGSSGSPRSRGIHPGGAPTVVQRLLSPKSADHLPDGAPPG